MAAIVKLTNFETVMLKLGQTSQDTMLILDPLAAWSGDRQPLDEAQRIYGSLDRKVNRRFGTKQATF